MDECVKTKIESQCVGKKSFLNAVLNITILREEGIHRAPDA